MTAKTEPRKTANVGRCAGVRSSGHCICPEFVKGREVAGLLVCARAECGHCQQVHARVEVAA